jgi:hypothetical protein
VRHHRLLPCRHPAGPQQQRRLIRLPLGVHETEQWLLEIEACPSRPNSGGWRSAGAWKSFLEGWKNFKFSYKDLICGYWYRYKYSLRPIKECNFSFSMTD